MAEYMTNKSGVDEEVFPNNCGLKVKIKDIIKANGQFEKWVERLRKYVKKIMTEDNASHSENMVNKSQKNAWKNCFEFISDNLKNLSADMQEFELIFEYSLPGTVHQRPDILLLTKSKVISLEFKDKEAPQIDDNKDDVAQAIRYKEWLENHHIITKEKKMNVKSYLVCTLEKAAKGNYRGVEVLTNENFCRTIHDELSRESVCSFVDEWLDSPKTEMPEMLQAIGKMYQEGKIPYISEVNRKCLDKVNSCINFAEEKHKKILILINGVPGAGKTAVGQSVVFEQNKSGKANAVYLSGNGPLVEVLQYQINKVGKSAHMGENAIQGIKAFKTNYIYKKKVPQQSILVFDEAQRAWEAEKLGNEFSEPQGLFDVCERIYAERGYAVLIGLYGDGQVIYEGEEKGLALWEEALQQHEDWLVYAAKDTSNKMQISKDRKIRDNDLFLSASLRADFIDCSKWVEQAICRTNATEKQAKNELNDLQKTSMRICVTRDFEKIKERTEVIKKHHPEWKYGLLISNFAEQRVIRQAMPGWKIGYNGENAVSNGHYGPWFTGECKKLDKACSVYGVHGLELDCPIVVFGGDYIRDKGKWIARGSRYKYYVQEKTYDDPDTIVENNHRVLLTRARREMIILVPDVKVLDETYQYFVDMGMDEL